MIGLGILIKVAKRLLGKPLEESGALPTRYYLHETLRSLDHDNIGEAVRLLKISKHALVDKPRWRLVRQLVLFRCRVLMAKHDKRIRHVGSLMETLEKEGGLPWRWFRKKPIEKLAQYENALNLEKRARALLEKYEQELKNM